jgi:hypothetical protein
MLENTHMGWGGGDMRTQWKNSHLPAIKRDLRRNQHLDLDFQPPELYEEICVVYGLQSCGILLWQLQQTNTKRQIFLYTKELPLVSARC